MLAEMLGEGGHEGGLRVAQIGSILDAIHLGSTLDTLTGAYTAYANIYDLHNGDIYLYYLGQFDEVVRLNMAQKLSKGEHIIDMSDVFSAKTIESAQAEFDVAVRLSNVIIGTVVGAILASLGIVFYITRMTLR